MALKTLQIKLADLEGAAQGLLASRADVEVRVAYTRQVILTDGTVIPPAQVVRGLSSTGIVQVQVYPSDDTSVRPEYRGFAIDVTVRGLPGSSGWRYEQRVKVLNAMTSPVALGTLAPAEGVPPQWTTVAEIGAQAGAAIQTLSNLKATATTTAPPNPASVTVTGAGVNKTMNFVIPRGADGAPGRDGMGYAEGLELTGRAEAAQTSAAQSAEDAELALQAKFLTQDEGVRALIETAAGQQTRAALDRRFGVDLNSWPGVDPTGVTECGAAIQAAVDHARSIGRPVVGSGFFKTASTVTLRDTADLSKCVFTYTPSTGTALIVGDPAGTIRKTIATPLVIAGAKTQTGWSQVASTIGVRVLNVESSNLTITGARNFEVGLDMHGQGSGTAYNNVMLGELGNNKVNLRHSNDATGWSNQNTFIGGRLAHEGSEGNLAPGTRHILHPAHASFPADGNTYIGVSLESPGTVEAIIESSGWYNQWIGCRFENYGPAGTKKVLWRNTARGNHIVGGYEADKLTVIADSTVVNNSVVSPLVDEVLWVSGLEMATVSGAPVREVIGGGQPVVTLRDSFVDGLGCSVRIPDGWLKVRVEALWAPDREATGSVVLTALSATRAEGASYKADWPPQVGSATVAAAGDGVVRATVLATGVTVAPGPQFISVRRDGDGGGDTFTGHIWLTGVRVTRVA